MTEPLVLLPGMMCDARVFAPQIAALSANTTLHFAPISGADTVEALAVSVLATAPPNFALAGLSMGGIVALEILRRAPERVMRLALMDTDVLSEIPSVAAAREEQIVKVRAGRLEEVMSDHLPADDLARGPHSDEIRDMVMRMARDLGPEVYVAQSRALQRRPDQQKTMRKLKAPTLILCGENDRITPPRRHEFMSSLVPHARFETIAGAGHLPTLEQPETVNRLLREWLAEPLVLR